MCVYVAGSRGGLGGSSARAARTASPPVGAPVDRGFAAGAASTPYIVVTAPPTLTASWTTVARVRGRAAAWVAQRSGVTLMRFDQSLVHLTLHAGSRDGGVVGWTYGDQITPREIHRVVAATAASSWATAVAAARGSWPAGTSPSR